MLWLSCASAGIPKDLARPASRPRRVPGGPVAGDWERSPAGPRAGAARKGEALGCWDPRPPWAFFPGQGPACFGASWETPGQGQRVIYGQ